MSTTCILIISIIVVIIITIICIFALIDFPNSNKFLVKNNKEKKKLFKAQKLVNYILDDYAGAGAGLGRRPLGLSDAGLGRRSLGLSDAGLKLDDAGLKLDDAGLGRRPLGLDDAGLGRRPLGLDDAGLGRRPLGLSDASLKLDDAGLRLYNAGLGLDDAGLEVNTAELDVNTNNKQLFKLDNNSALKLIISRCELLKKLPPTYENYIMIYNGLLNYSKKNDNKLHKLGDLLGVE